MKRSVLFVCFGVIFASGFSSAHYGNVIAIAISVTIGLAAALGGMGIIKGILNKPKWEASRLCFWEDLPDGDYHIVCSDPHRRYLMVVSPKFQGNSEDWVAPVASYQPIPRGTEFIEKSTLPDGTYVLTDWDGSEIYPGHLGRNPPPINVTNNSFEDVEPEPPKP